MLVLLLPGSEGEVWNVGSGNRGGFDEVKVCSQRILYGIIVDSWDGVAITNYCCFWQWSGEEDETSTGTEE